MHLSLTRTLRRGAALLLAAGVLAACTDETQGPTLGDVEASLTRAPNPTTYDFTLAGTYSSAGTCDVSVSGKVFLDGVVVFEDTCDLTLAAGTVVYADTTESSVLVINKGAKIFANGTASSEVVFTSAANQGARRAGHWGGIIIVGKSTCNAFGVVGDDCLIEGLNGLPINGLTYGQASPVNNDNSGSLTYVRIEFTGRVVTDGDEVNALTLYGVGSGTTISHVQAHRGTDDGFEWFGGTVNAKYLVATAISDDSYDYSYGFNGSLQFGIAQQLTNDGDKGIEADNDEVAFTNTPTTNPAVYNFTLIGRCSGASCADVNGASNNSNDGIHLRRGVGGVLRNVIVLGWQGSALDVDDAQTFTLCPQIDYAYFFNAAEGSYDPDTDPDATTDQEADCVVTGSTSIFTSDPQVRDPYNRTTPNFALNRTSPARSNGTTTLPTGNTFLTAVSYHGAVPSTNAATDPAWYTGWTDFSAN